MLAGDAAGEQLLALLRPVAGDQEQLTPPEPLRGVEEQAVIVAEPEAEAVGRELMVTVALPDEVPGQFASDTAVTVYTVGELGLTLRVAGLTVTPFWVAPSDQVRFHGPAPVRAAWIVVDPPAQIVASPDTTAVGCELTVTVTCAVFADTQPFESVTVRA